LNAPLGFWRRVFCWGKEGGLRLHPILTKLVDAETLEKMGASKMQ
jgi:hypothetical protein